MQGRSIVPLLRGERPADWRKSWYYRYYHDPGDHNVRAHYGVRTETHKLIYFWKKDQWECYDLVHDPEELHNIYGDPAQAGLIADLKKELYRLKKELQDNDEFAEKQPPDDVDRPPRPWGKNVGKWGGRMQHRKMACRPYSKANDRKIEDRKIKPPARHFPVINLPVIFAFVVHCSQYCETNTS